MKKNLLLPLLILGLLAILGFVIYRIFVNSTHDTSNQTITETFEPSVQSFNEFHSDSLNIFLNIPTNFEIQDKLIDVVLRSGEGKIVIGRSGTNYSSLQEYWVNQPQTNKDGISQEKWLTIDGYEAVSAQLHNTRLYKIFIDGIIFTIETENPELYDDLEQIAQSFRYTP